jgi:hypothetical protein
MAILNGLQAMFTASQIRNYVEAKAREFQEKTIEVAQYMGEEFVNKAREMDTYRDRTGNLRSSIGYVIVLDGKLVDQNFKPSAQGTDKNTGTAKAIEFAEELAGQYPSGLILIGVAGMEYAAYVEAKGYDVITGSAPTSEDFKSLFSEIQF